MAELSTSIKLRPTRIGFLVRPNDMAAVRRIMRACACVWGGLFNPIIPVFRMAPREWRGGKHDRAKGTAVAKGYVRFFEPDVYVEAESGLLEKAGLGALRDKSRFHSEALSLDEFLVAESHRDWSEPAYGLNIRDIMRHLYETERRFQLRDGKPSVLVKPRRSGALVEAVFGTYPTQRDVAYIVRTYKDVFRPQTVEPNEDTWLKVFKDGAQTPLRATRHGLDVERFWHHDLLVYIFDPDYPTDLIDLWNLRLEPRPVVPVPHKWVEKLAGYLVQVLKAEHRPVKGNPHGVMHHPTIEFGRSLGQARIAEVTKLLVEGLPAGAAMVKQSRNRVWEGRLDDRMMRDERMSISADETNTSVTLKEEQHQFIANIATLAPEFASRFGGHDYRWINAVTVREHGRERIATVLPFNLFDRSWPRVGMGGEKTVIGSEGWVFGQRYKNWSETIKPLGMEEAISGSLKGCGLQAHLSEPGDIAKQMLDHLGGLWGVHLLADVETIRLLNKMAGGVRRRGNTSETVEETFERRSALVKDWADLVARRKARRSLPKMDLAEFAKRNVIRLGLETDCPHCHAKNWHSMADVDYEVSCDRCIKHYPFPEADLREHNRNWYYRVVGPFAVPDYGRGSYSALLALRVIRGFGGSSNEMTFSTAMKLKGDGIDCEVDFVAWLRRDRHGRHDPPDLVIGETKSLGERDVIKPSNVRKLRALGQKLPGTIFVVGVLRDAFTTSEKKLLKRFVQWGRRPNEQGQPTNPVVILSAHELLFDFLISSTWKDLGDPWKAYADYDHTRNIHAFAEATQRIYLGLPPFHETRAAAWRKRLARRKPSHNMVTHE